MTTFGYKFHGVGRDVKFWYQRFNWWSFSLRSSENYKSRFLTIPLGRKRKNLCCVKKRTERRRRRRWLKIRRSFTDLFKWNKTGKTSKSSRRRIDSSIVLVYQEETTLKGEDHYQFQFLKSILGQAQNCRFQNFKSLIKNLLASLAHSHRALRAQCCMLQSA